MEGWTEFFLGEVGAAAALAGLLVVAISINVSRILSLPILPGRAAQTLVIVAGALVVSSFALFPRQPLALFGWEALTVGLAVVATGLFHFAQSLRRRGGSDPLAWSLTPLVVVALAAVPTLVGAVLLIVDGEAGIAWIAVGVIASLVATLLNGWVLLVEILR